MEMPSKLKKKIKQTYRQERGVFENTVVFTLDKKSPPPAAILFSFAKFATSR